MTVSFLSENMEPRKKCHSIFQMLKERNCQDRILYTMKIAFSNSGEIETFSNEGKLKELVTSIPNLKEC